MAMVMRRDFTKRAPEGGELRCFQVILDTFGKNTGSPVMCLITRIDSTSATPLWRARPLLAISEYFCRLYIELPRQSGYWGGGGVGALGGITYQNRDEGS